MHIYWHVCYFRTVQTLNFFMNTKWVDTRRNRKKDIQIFIEFYKTQSLDFLMKCNLSAPSFVLHLFSSNISVQLWNTSLWLCRNYLRHDADAVFIISQGINRMSVSPKHCCPVNAMHYQQINLFCSTIHTFERMTQIIHTRYCLV